MAEDPHKRRQRRLESHRGGESEGLIHRLLPKTPRNRFFTVAAIFTATAFLLTTELEQFLINLAGTADPKSAVQVARGREIYYDHCAYCHGDYLGGQPGWDLTYPEGGRPPTPLDETGPAPLRPDQALHDIIKYGGQRFSPQGYENDMPGFEHVLDDSEIWAVIAFIKSRWPEAVRQEQQRLGQ